MSHGYTQAQLDAAKSDPKYKDYLKDDLVVLLKKHTDVKTSLYPNKPERFIKCKELGEIRGDLPAVPTQSAATGPAASGANELEAMLRKLLTPNGGDEATSKAAPSNSAPPPARTTASPSIKKTNVTIADLKAFYDSAGVVYKASMARPALTELLTGVSVAQLKTLCDAHGLTYNSRTVKGDLVKSITDATPRR